MPYKRQTRLKRPTYLPAADCRKSGRIGLLLLPSSLPFPFSDEKGGKKVRKSHSPLLYSAGGEELEFAKRDGREWGRERRGGGRKSSQQMPFFRMASLVWAFFLQALVYLLRQGGNIFIPTNSFVEAYSGRNLCFSWDFCSGATGKKKPVFAVLLCPTTVSALLKIKE